MGKLHDRLEEIGYTGHPLEVYLVRILFLLFSEDTSIFMKQQFQDYIEQRTSEDGSDLAAKLQDLFQVLNKPIEKRFTNLDEQLLAFPYVNGRLFEEILPNASFDAKMRQSLLECCYLDWSKISPAIFGSMFQSVMDPKERRNLGAHYTSEKNILKLIKPLFLDDLRAEFDRIKGNKNLLREFQYRLSKLRFLDPACGCGNFLVITYRELRLLELDVLRLLFTHSQEKLVLETASILEVDMMCGIEYEEFPARIAEVAMWLIDHQMNMQISNEFGQYFIRLPLIKSAKIVHGNALQTDWENVVSKNDLSFIIGNPPFIGFYLQTAKQKKDMDYVFNDLKNHGMLDYVSAWYTKAARYIQNTKIKVAFVSTNSIVQGEQVGVLWQYLLSNYKLIIHFAHRTFKWGNEAKGNAAVYCVIIGFANFDTNDKSIFEYEDIKGEAHEIKAKNINPYLVDGKNLLIQSNSTPICDVPKIVVGNLAYDGGFLTFSKEQKEEFLVKEPNASKFMKPLLGAKEYINKGEKWCLWLLNANPEELNKLPLVLERIKKVKETREQSTAISTRRLASTPSLFRDRNQPKSFVLIPRTTSENRKYVPLGFFDENTIVADSCLAIENGKIFHFGVLFSSMHMTWLKYTCGRLKSDFRYSKDIVYNNFPWPENPNEKQIKAIEAAAQKVLDARLQFPNSSLADLYDPLTMPPALVKAHNELDKAVDLAYRAQAFTSEAKRMEFLFELYEKYTADLFTKEKVKKTNKKKES
jgi:type I restriction-modification system DNA methylase subunit